MRIWQLLEQNLNPMQPSRDTPSESGWLYHATNLEGAEGIFQDGQFDIHPPWHGTDQEAWPDGSESPRAYFTANAGVAWDFAPAEGQSVLLRVPEGASDFRRESTGDFYARQPVPAVQAQILAGDGRWYPLKVFLGRMSEAFGGTPVGSPNRQSADSHPDFMTQTGASAVPVEDVIPEFKPEEFEAELESLMDDKSVAEDAESSLTKKQTETLMGLMSRDRNNKFMVWLQNVYEEEWQEIVEEPPQIQAEYFEQYLDEEHHIRVTDDGWLDLGGWIDPSGESEHFLRGMNIEVYHFTSDALLPSIREEGLHTAHGRTVNYYSTLSGVYLTIDPSYSSPPNRQYQIQAVDKLGGEPMRLTIVVPYDDLHPDPDDSDIQSGMVQFITDYVPAAWITGVNDDQKLREVDHPEYMPQEGPARYDPEFELGQPDERQRGYNKGHPAP